jgi:hypothetical protein
MSIRIPILLAALVLTGLVSRSASVMEEMMKKLILRITAALAAVLLMGGTVYAQTDTAGRSAQFPREHCGGALARCSRADL